LENFLPFDRTQKSGLLNQIVLLTVWREPNHVAHTRFGNLKADFPAYPENE